MPLQQPSQSQLVPQREKGVTLFAMIWHRIRNAPTTLQTWLLECDLLGIRQLSRIERKVDKIMADIDTLNATLAGIASDVDEVVVDVANLQSELATANANSGVDLTGAIAAANAIRTKLDALAASANPPSEPGPAPAGSGSSDPQPGA